MKFLSIKKLKCYHKNKHRIAMESTELAYSYPEYTFDSLIDDPVWNTVSSSSLSQQKLHTCTNYNNSLQKKINAYTFDMYIRTIKATTHVHV